MYAGFWPHDSNSKLFIFFLHFSCFFLLTVYCKTFSKPSVVSFDAVGLMMRRASSLRNPSSL